MKPLYFTFCLFFFIHITAFPQRVFPYSYHGKYGLIDANYNIIIEPKYKHIDLFPGYSDNPYTIFSQYDSTGEIIVVYGIIDKNGKEVIPAKFTKLEYDGNKKYAFSMTPSNTIEVLDILTGKSIHKQTYSKYISKAGLVVIRAPDGDMHTMIFRDHTIRQHKGRYVNIVPADDSYCYECSDSNVLTYYDADGNLVKDYRQGGYLAGAEINNHGRNKNKEIWIALKEKFGESTLSRVYDDNRLIVCVIYKDPASGKYKLLNPEGDIIFEDDEISAMSGLNSMYIKFKKGKYWGVVTFKGNASFKAEFKNIYVLSKEHNYLWLEHRSGYSGVGITSGKVYLPKESGYY